MNLSYRMMLSPTRAALLLVLLGACWAVAPAMANKAAGEGEPPIGIYFRPPKKLVSGVPQNPLKYHRAPCPGLNTLANHGFINRNGKCLTGDMIRDALQKRYGLDASAAGALVATLPATFSSLADLSVSPGDHNASLVHDDTHLGVDPAFPNLRKVRRLQKFAGSDGQLDKQELGRYHSLVQKASTPLDASQITPALLEASSILTVMGDSVAETISKERLWSFLAMEKFPDDYSPSATPITAAQVFGAAQGIGTISASTQSCPLGFDDCDGDQRNKCETSVTNRRNCGGCFNRCKGSTVCSEGVCLKAALHK